MKTIEIIGVITINMFEAFILGAGGVLFLILSIRHPIKVHEDIEPITTGTFIGDLFFLLMEKLPKRVVKSLYLLVAIALFIWSYMEATS
jgi:hypothetical protein